MKRLPILAAVAAAAVFLPGMQAGTLTGMTGDLPITLAGQVVQFAPTGGDNLTIVGDFAGAPTGVAFPAEVTMLNFAGPAVRFQHGTYIIGLQLEPGTNSFGQVTPLSSNTFSSFFDVFFDASFNYTGAGSGDSSGDVLGEFGSLPGISNCVSGAVATCELRETLALTGIFDAAANTFTNVSATVATPEPASIRLGGSALLLLLLALRRKR